jgi:hypothetical protein
MMDLNANVRKNLGFSMTLMSSLIVLGACGSMARKAPVMLPSIPSPKPSAAETLVVLHRASVFREVAPHISVNSTGFPDIEEMPAEELTRGDLTVGNEPVSFFLPLYGPHAVTSKEHHSFENTSTLVSVDSDHDGKPGRTEGWWSSLPVRLGDQMFDVKMMDPGGKWILFGKSSSPLAGVIVGKPCPDFQFLTTDGKTATLADYKGKALLLDVWSMT